MSKPQSLPGVSLDASAAVADADASAAVADADASAAVGDPDGDAADAGPAVEDAVDEEQDSRGAGTSAVALLPLICPICDTRYPADFRVCPRDTARLEDAEDDTADPLIGAVIGGSYEIVRPIGEGGMARVYEARHVRLSGKRFAVKILHASYAAQPTVVARFQREAEACAAIDHPNVVDVYDVHRTADGQPYLVTEFLDGQDLGSMLEGRGKLEPAIAVHIGRELCRALSAAHARGIIHRDMKPENVFVMGDERAPQVKVLDFGISKIMEDRSSALTRTGTIVGTPAYISPEQAAGRPVDQRTDIYAVGAILYRALTGRLPFDGESTAQILSAVLAGNAPRPRTLEPAISDTLEMTLQRAMAVSPTARFATMQELEQELAFEEQELEPPGQQLEPARELARTEPGEELPPSDSSGASARLQRATRRSSSRLRSPNAREARRSRPTVIVSSLILCLWATACLTHPLALWLGQDAKQGSGSAARLLFVLLGVAIVAAGPTVLWIRYLMRVWPNAMAVLELARLLRLMVAAAVGTYASVSLLAGLFTLAGALELSGLALSAFLAVASFGAGSIVAGFRLRLQRRS